MKVGIIGAMEQEVAVLRDRIENRQTMQRAGCESIPARCAAWRSHC